ncbi:hypothetical protein KC930_03715 [Candidatus Saccharibacteria bacterium]|nr:hypothetical protein [Candidatus Saccharibacteria bacterium]
MVNLLSNLGFSDPREKFDRDDRPGGGYVDAREMLQDGRVSVLRGALVELPVVSEETQHDAIKSAFTPSTTQAMIVESLENVPKTLEGKATPQDVVNAEAMTVEEMKMTLNNENFGIAA